MSQFLKGLTAEAVLLTTFHTEARCPSLKSYVDNAMSTTQLNNRNVYRYCETELKDMITFSH